MHPTEDASLLPPVSGSKIFRQFLVLLLALAATSVFGQESVLTLAMVRYDKSPAWTPAEAHSNTATDLFCYDVSAPRLPSRVAALKLDYQSTTDFTFDSRLEKQSEPIHQHDLIQLVHTKLYSDGRMGKWMNVAAGYGQVCQHETDIAKNMEDLQRPGFAYLSASFSF